MLLGDIGTTAALACAKELHRAELSIFRPIKCMLATPEPTAEAVWERFVKGNNSAEGTAAATVYVEDKFDGIRAQLHRTTKRRSEEHTSELQSPCNLVCRLLLEKQKNGIQPGIELVLLTIRSVSRSSVARSHCCTICSRISAITRTGLITHPRQTPARSYSRCLP